jgi:PAS domain S-box-containing protein/putative nucleotidyltransferase with HDIG domain
MMKITELAMSKETADHLGDVLLLMGLDGSILDANPAAVRCYGYAYDELVRMNVRDIRAPSDQDSVDAQLRGAAEQGGSFRVEHRRADGTLFPVEVWTAPVVVEGEPALLVVHDVTDSQTSASALASAASRLKAMFEFAPMGIALDDVVAGHIVEVNPAYAKILGRTPEEIRRLDWKSITHPDDLKADLENMERLTSGEIDKFQMEKRYFRPDGSVVWVNMTVASVLVGDEAHPGRVCMIEDITDAKAAEQELASQQAQIAKTLTSVIDIVGDIVETRDPYTAGHQRRVAELAARMARELGMPEPDIANVRMAALLHDIGKITVPTEVLSKPGTLSALEYQLIRGHTDASRHFISSAHLPDEIAEMIYEHHERCDGSGYPRGLTCDQMLPGAKVIVVADVVEAMMSHRPYRPALGIDAALAEIEQGAGRLYDADVAKVCVALFREGRFEFAA